LGEDKTTHIDQKSNKKKVMICSGWFAAQKKKQMVGV